MGRGKRRLEARREIPLSDAADARERRLPDGLKQALGRQPDSYDFTLLSELRLRLKDGYADDDVSEVSAQVGQAVGFPFCVVWDYREDGFCAGSAEEYLLKDSRLCPLPRALYELLFEGTVPEAEDLDRELAALRPTGIDMLDVVEVAAGNYVLEDRDA